MTIAEPRLNHVCVRDAMHTGMLSTDPSTPLRVVAALMAANRVHAVAVADPNHARRPRGFVSAHDVLAAVAHDREITAGQAARTEVVAVPADASIELAAHTMITHDLAHLIVVDPVSGHPCGIISALDIARVYGGE